MKRRRTQPEATARLGEDSPEYRAEVRRAPRKLTCIDLFAGCGGLSLGLERAGFHPLLFSELNKSAAETYIANRVGKGIIPWGDIYQLTDENLELLKLQWSYHGVDDVDLVCGGPPCQGYSGIGHRRSFKIEKQDIPSNHLYQEMARVIRCVKQRLRGKTLPARNYPCLPSQIATNCKTL